MSEPPLKPTACNICYANCGILVETDGREIVKVRGDKAHPASLGYTCNKAARINFYQNGKDRLSSPLKRKDDGTFEEIDWDTAIKEVAGRFAAIRDEFGGDKIMYYGGGGQGNHLGGSYAIATRAALGIKYRSNALAQEKTGLYWTRDRVVGGKWHGDFENCDVAVIVGKNPWQSNGMQRARVVMRDLGKADDKTLIVFDPRKSETAELADIHLAIKPGTDVWCIMAILGHMVQTGLANIDWLQEHTIGYEPVLEQLQDVDVETYAAYSGIEMSQIVGTAEALASTQKIALYEDLGIEMAPYSTLCTYLNMLLFLIPGGFGVEGAMHLTLGLASTLGGKVAGSIDEFGYEHDFPVSPVTGARIVTDLMPCNSIPEEILTDDPNRFRGMLVESSNPMHSLADTPKFKEAFEALDLLVVIDVAMTETAMLADYILPASSQYEKHEWTIFPSEFPENFTHLRKPLFDPMPGTLPEAEMHARIIEELGVFEDGELAELRSAAEKGLASFGEAFVKAMAARKVRKFLPYVLYRTLGPSLSGNAAAAASLYGLAQRFTNFNSKAVKAAGYKGEGIELGNNLFQAILDGSHGVVISRHAWGDETQWPKPDSKIHLFMGEMSEVIEELKEFKLPERSSEFPLLLSAGDRRLYTGMTTMRDPRWMKSNNPHSLYVHPNDAEGLGIQDSGHARLVTKRGEAEVFIEFDDRQREGTIALPNALGLLYPNASGELEKFGVAPNDLTSLEDRDEFVGTPWHKHVLARLEPLPS